ncbi:hypothetical protein O181_025295, partial [Austropuccinia psidii MF-1]|nr:hypothetical protein [Austropuccinia psidii MF-1]
MGVTQHALRGKTCEGLIPSGIDHLRVAHETTCGRCACGAVSLACACVGVGAFACAGAGA